MPDTTVAGAGSWWVDYMRRHAYTTGARSTTWPLTLYADPARIRGYLTRCLPSLMRDTAGWQTTVYE